MERQKKEQLTARNPKRAWESIKEMILNDEDMTTEELDAELREYGINPDESVRRLFELALRISRKPGAGGRVSRHVSEILNQLTARCYESEVNVTAAQGNDAGERQGSFKQKDAEIPAPVPLKARAAVLSYHRNYKDESQNDRAIRLKNESRLQEIAENLKRKKRDPKK